MAILTYSLFYYPLYHIQAPKKNGLVVVQATVEVEQLIGAHVPAFTTVIIARQAFGSQLIKYGSPSHLSHLDHLEGPLVRIRPGDFHANGA